MLEKRKEERNKKNSAEKEREMEIASDEKHGRSITSLLPISIMMVVTIFIYEQITDF